MAWRGEELQSYIYTYTTLSFCNIYTIMDGSHTFVITDTIINKYYYNLCWIFKINIWCTPKVSIIYTNFSNIVWIFQNMFMIYPKVLRLLCTFHHFSFLIIQNQNSMNLFRIWVNWQDISRYLSRIFYLYFHNFRINFSVSLRSENSLVAVGRVFVFGIIY